MNNNQNKMEKIVAWAKRRGFIWPSSEIYGGIGGVYDFGPLGLELKNNFKNFWWQRFVRHRDDIVPIESAVLMSRKVWQASGHEEDFKDSLVECKKCHKRFRLDELANPKSDILISKQIQNPKGAHESGREVGGSESKIPNCPECDGEFTQPKLFNLMFKTFIGPVEADATMTYLRPETAQGMFVNFKQVLETSRKKLPFGIAQIGKSFRNEITPGNFIYRMREFEIAEIEYFVPSPSSGQVDEDEKWFDYWVEQWQKFFLDLGIKKSNLEKHEHQAEKLAHYSKKTVDLIYKFPFGKQELAGIANRTDYDLKRHQEYSGKDLKYFDEESGKKFIPYVIEPTLGIERAILAILIDAFEEVGKRSNEKKEGGEVVLHLPAILAPIKVAVFPLVSKDKLPPIAKEIYDDLKPRWATFYDEVGSIGRRYRRQDEIGTPYCVTVDFKTLKDKTVTVRDRDTMKQVRVKIAKLKEVLATKLVI